jgi:hypothetical protein
MDYLPLHSPLFKQLNGWIRARRIDYLSNATSLFTPACHGVFEMTVLRQVQAFFKKSDAFGTDEERLAVAKASFYESEAICAVTNRRLETFYSENHGIKHGIRQEHTWLSDKISKMEKYISSTLGDFVSFRDTLPRRLRVTGGATSTRSRRSAVPFMKVHHRATCSSRAQPYVLACAKFFGYKVRPTVCNWNRVEFVPKDWKTDRTIACEPDWNVPFQLAFDDYAKSRLKRRGIDLSDQSRNQELARLGSIGNHLATIDLKSASDRVAFNAVALLFPTEWLQYLADLRSPYYRVGTNAFGRYEKFSSMGNGTTFVIETLIFAAACAALRPETYSVYGDDIIIDADKVTELRALLAFLGFTFNHTKNLFQRALSRVLRDGLV